MQFAPGIEAANQVQLQLRLSDDQAALWRVGLAIIDGRRTVPLQWEGYAVSSTAATAAATAWAHEQTAEADPPVKIRVLEVLQVGT